MLQVKDTKFFNEINTFFTDSQNPVFLVLDLYKFLGIRIKSPMQSTYSRSYKLFHLLMVFLLNLRNINQYTGSYQAWIECSKDVFYRLKNNSNLNWRNIINQVNKKLILKSDNNKGPTCFIIDDTDFPKRGKTMEFIGKIFNHVKHSYQLGYKSLHLNYWNGTSLYSMDNSLHIELGKNENQGMRLDQLENRFVKNRKENSPSQLRINELTENKINVAIRMMKRQLRLGFSAKYVLADSWFTCYELIKSSVSLGIDYLGMAKIGKTKYLCNDKLYDASELILKNKHTRIKNRKLKLTCFTVGNLRLKGIPIKAFFFKSGQNGRYHLLITTDLKLNIVDAYEIYRIRWTIEVFFKECKQNLGLGKCQSTCMDSQITDTALSMLSYNILSAIKEKNEYTSIGGLFKDMSKNCINPNLAQRFTELLEAIIDELQDLLEIDIFEILEEKINHPDFETKYLKTFLKLAS